MTNTLSYLNVNGLNSLIKRHKVVECVKEDKIQQYATYKTHISFKEAHSLKMSDRNGVSHKMNFQSKLVTRERESYYIVVKGSVHQEYTTIVNIYAPNTGAHKYFKQILIN